MKKVSFILVFFLVLSSISCTKREDASRKPTEWGTYQDSKYPISIKYPLITETNEVKAGINGMKAYSIDVSANLLTEFPDFPWHEDKENDIRYNVLENVNLVYINFFSSVDVQFKGQFRVLLTSSVIDELSINSIPMLRVLSRNPYGASYVEENYIPIIPGHYVTIEPELGSSYGDYIKEKNSRAYERVIQLSRETLNSITWQKPIDTNSKEFKDWKAHILSLIKETKDVQ